MRPAERGPDLLQQADLGGDLDPHCAFEIQEPALKLNDELYKLNHGNDMP